MAIDRLDRWFHSKPKSVPDLDGPDLLDWADLADERRWTGLLIGNGASISCWSEFNYQSLFDRAQDANLDHSLDGDDVGIFDAFHTTNFEQVLAALKTSTLVLNALQRDAGFLTARYESIQEALFDAIHAVHVPWGVVPSFEEKLQAMRAAIEEFDWIYSLNYDLILYWAITSVDKGVGIADFFWNDSHSFDPANSIPKDFAKDWPKVLWLHGGIHLRRQVDGTTFKEVADERANLLEKFKTPAAGSVTPLLVSEGTAHDKYRAILRSAYLDFALRRLGQHAGPLVVFGSSLRDEDKHLIRAMNEQPIEDIAVSVHQTGDADSIVQRKASLRAQFPASNLYFFDAATHPLGSPDMRFE